MNKLDLIKLLYTKGIINDKTCIGQALETATEIDKMYQSVPSQAVCKHIIETETAIQIPFIGLEIRYDEWEKACKVGGMKWQQAMDWCNELGGRMPEMEEVGVIRYCLDEIDEVLTKRGLPSLKNESNKNWFWSASQYSSGLTWCWGGESWSHAHNKNYSSRVLTVFRHLKL